MTPGAYRRGGDGEVIRYTVTPTGLGAALVAVTGRGVCAIKLGDTAAALERELRTEFPEARLERADQALDAVSRRVVRILDGGGVDPALPLDIRGTAFQARVWRELARIPAGQTRTYGEVAQAIGQPRAVRAVASAIAANRLAVVVPCHRVVRGDGGLGGYRWGVERKETLLKRESPTK
jgi:AraC family transcriptional regulator of adaptative response/methylated-DNA-[protein]-cysteine methyltransferase